MNSYLRADSSVRGVESWMVAGNDSIALGPDMVLAIPDRRAGLPGFAPPEPPEETGWVLELQEVTGHSVRVVIAGGLEE